MANGKMKYALAAVALLQMSSVALAKDIRVTYVGQWTKLWFRA